MTHLVTFESFLFDPAEERENPINPIPGYALLEWLKGELAKQGISSTEIDFEDWGWYFEVEQDAKYLVGAAGNGEAQPLEWIIQVQKLRSLSEKMFGKSKMVSDDPLFKVIENLVRSEPGFEKVTVDLDA